jgi:hypothetical protein
MKLNIHFIPTDCEPFDDHTRYHNIVESLVYLDVPRLDILYSIYIMCQFVFASTQIHSFFVSCVIFMRLTLIVCSFHVLTLYSSKHIMMLSCLVISRTIVLFLFIMFFLMIFLLLERLKSNL